MNEFQEKGYEYVFNVLNDHDIENISKRMFKYRDEKFYLHDGECPISIGFFNICPEILLEKKPLFERICGKKLSPTYSYGRIYKKGEVLKMHIDRPSCEISVTLTVKCYGSIWPIFMKNEKIEIQEGDAVLYKGHNIEHGREKYLEGEQQLQIFLHYVTNDGPYTDYAYEYIKRWKKYCYKIKEFWKKENKNGTGD